MLQNYNKYGTSPNQFFLQEYHEPLLKTFTLCLRNTKCFIIAQISQAEPKKLASVIKPKTRHALGIAVVGFAGDHLKDKKVTEFNTLD